MLGASSGLGCSASAAAQVHEGGSSIMAGIVDDDKGLRDEFGDRGGPAGNRWPRQETLALLKIRSDMDVVFRDSSLKGPLWEEVSRKMAELGYHRSAKKCKEKFENVYKYHKRTKEGRAGKSDGKTYRFFDQLEALENQPPALPPIPRPPPQAAVPVSVAMPASSPILPAVATVPQVTVPSTTSQANTIMIRAGAVAVSAPQLNPTNSLPSPPPQPPPAHPQPASSMQTSTGAHSHQNPIIQPSHPVLSHHHHHPVPSTPSSSPSSSSSTSSDEEILGRRKRKRKWKDFFERLMKEVIDKQEELQKRFLEAIDKREHDRLVREEAWKLQEMARLNREHEILVQERSMAAAKDAALIAFLQKLSEQQQIPLPLPFTQTQNQTRPSPSPAPAPAPTPPPPPPAAQPPPQQIHENPSPVSLPPQQPPQQPLPVPAPAPHQQPQQQPAPQPQLQLTPVPSMPQSLSLVNVEGSRSNNGDNLTPASSSRWPKAEVQALINLRTSLDQKYQESGPKGPLWEEISASMRKIGYNRNAKRCKEKWENINKYFKKVKESNKKRPEDSKTCPYFHQLDQLYREKTSSNNYGGLRHAMIVGEGGSIGAPIMAQPEQQWPLPPVSDQDPSDNADLNDDDDEGDDEDDDNQGYELVANNSSAASSMGGAGGGATARMETS